MKTIEIYSPIYVMSDNKMIYRIGSFSQLGSNEHCFNYNLELVAGFDYIKPDYSNEQGFVSKEGFIESVQYDSITVYPLHESLGERLSEEGYKVVNIEDYVIHEFRTE